MKALVIKTGTVVDIITMKGDYFIDSNNSPYKREELDFDNVPADAKTNPSLPFGFPGLFGPLNSQLCVQLAIQYMKDHREKGYTVEEVVNFVDTAMIAFKTL